MSKRNHLKERLNKKLEAITFETLIVGVDIAKHNQWARFVDCRGIEHNKALKFENNRNDFNAILTRIYEICKQEDFNRHWLSKMGVQFFGLLDWLYSHFFMQLLLQLLYKNP